MCGFAGYYGAGDFNREEVIDQMGERIAHRGPDSKGSFVDDYVALGFRRLSIIDLEGGSQPIHSADGKHVIIFQGESDAVIVKGIVSLLINILSGHTPQEILDADLYFIDKVGLKEHLSPTRSNGLVAMVKQMRLYAMAYRAKEQQ